MLGCFTTKDFTENESYDVQYSIELSDTRFYGRFHGIFLGVVKRIYDKHLSDIISFKIIKDFGVHKISSNGNVILYPKIYTTVIF